MSAPAIPAADATAAVEEEGVSALFGRFLTDRAAVDEDLYYITADSMSESDPFPRRYPDRFVNVGMAEQNAVSIGSGLAQSGKNVYLSNISTFLLYRPFDQIRLDAAHANARLRLIGTSAGLSRAMYGNAHISVEDIAVLRALPNMTVVAPGDRTELLDLLAEVDRLPGPAYIRLPTESTVLPVLHPPGTRIRLGRSTVLREGDLGTLIATGHVLEQAVAWVDEWRRKGFAVRLVSMPSIKPLDTARVAELVAEGRPIATFEEHSVIGGLGSAVAETVAEAGGGVPFRRIGLPDRYPGRPGSAEYLKKVLDVPGSEQVLAWFLSAPGARRPSPVRAAALVDNLYYDGAVYDQRYADYADDVPFWRDLARRHGPDVLELAAGTGRISVPLAQDGHDVTGIDVAPAMLREAEHKRTPGLRLKLHEADMRDFDLGRRFRLVLLPCSSISHLLNDSDLAACLARVREHLTDDGVFALDLVNPAAALTTEADGRWRPAFQYRDPRDGRGVAVRRARHYDPVSQVLVDEMEYRRDGVEHVERVTRHSRMRTLEQAERLLAEGGFTVTRRHGGFAGEPCTATSRHLVLVCTKDKEESR
ncbi:transketolase C-terminal domain-containing protein [Streptomyces sp. NPDC006552]|uniref:transketolase C-terminal domain-containing protein n=1 Tax=Streptomyces sp. NPDC006552 TaxID=3157179 RepID=UPI0033B78829